MICLIALGNFRLETDHLSIVQYFSTHFDTVTQQRNGS